MSNLLTRWFSRQTKSTQVRRRTRPTVELLEDRTVPAVFEVNTLLDTVDADPNVTSLREAITAANDLAGDDSITFAADLVLPGTINLGSALPELSTNISISGPGADLLEVSRNTGGNYRIFAVSFGATVTLSGLTISNGQLSAGGYGGGIDNSGTLTLTGCTVSGHSTTLGGGGIHNLGALTVIDSIVDSNSTDGNGGGILNFATLTVTNSIITSNSALDGGGAFNGDGGAVTATNTLFSDNSADQDGGGILSDSGTVTITNSTLSGNAAGRDGGGMMQRGGATTFTNVTITDNRSDSDDDGAGLGGGIRSAAGAPTLHNTLVAGNFMGADVSRYDIDGAVDAASSHNLIGDGSHLSGISHGVNGNQIGTDLTPIDPRMGPLEDNGGPSLTHALLGDSPAIARGLFAGAPVADQRNFPRFGIPDIGAFEWSPAFEVNTLADAVDADPTVTSLREAIIMANAQPGDESIAFAADLALPGTINLGSALPDLSNIAIWGPGADLLEVRRDTGGDYRIFTVAFDATVVLSGLKISNGNVPGGDGGGINNTGGTLTLSDSVVTGSSALRGGGIYNGGTLTVTGSTVSANSAAIAGGGIQNYGTLSIASSTILGNVSSEAGGGISTSIGAVTLSNTIVSGNSADYGGGFYNVGSTVTFTNCTVSNNSATTLTGVGGIYNATGTMMLSNTAVAGNSSIGAIGGIANGGTLSLTNSTVSGNSAMWWAGGIYNFGTLDLGNSTISGNSASDSAGGLFVSSGSATLLNVTITNNRADADNNGSGSGGGILVSGGATLTLHNTIAAGNFKGAGATRDDIFGAITAASSFNLIGDGTGLTGISDGVNGNQIGTALAPIDPRLGPLANNGGPTQTHALLTGSPALDRGLFFGAPASDQRGVGRFRAPDIGAFELPAPVGLARVVNATSMVTVTKTKLKLMATGRLRQKVTLVNKTGQRIQGPISLVLDKLTVGVKLWQPTGRTKVWLPLKSFYLDRLPGDGILDPGEKLTFVLEFVVPAGTTAVKYKVRVLAGKGPR